MNVKLNFLKIRKEKLYLLKAHNYILSQLNCSENYEIVVRGVARSKYLIKMGNIHFVENHFVKSHKVD